MSNVDLGERVAKIETKIDFIIQHMESLPPSPQTLKRLDEIEAKADSVASFNENLKGKLAIAGAGFMLMGSILLYAFNWVLNHVTVGSN